MRKRRLAGLNGHIPLQGTSFVLCTVLCAWDAGQLPGLAGNAPRSESDYAGPLGMLGA